MKHCVDVYELNSQWQITWEKPKRKIMNEGKKRLWKCKTTLFQMNYKFNDIRDCDYSIHILNCISPFLNPVAENIYSIDINR